MKTWITLVAMAVACVFGQPPEPPKTVATYHNCVVHGWTSNSPHYQDLSETYQCDEGRVELKGRWSMYVEHNVVYRTTMGRVDGEPRAATDFDYKAYKWCADPTLWDKNQKELCGILAPVPVRACSGEKSAILVYPGDWICVPREEREHEADKP